MSIIHSLKKLFDPVEARLEEEDWRTQREPGGDEASGDPPLYRCRLCKEQAAERAYCPRCLAPTMEPAPDPRED